MVRHQAFSRELKTSQPSRQALLPFIRDKHLTGSSKNPIRIIFDGYPESGFKAQEEVIFSCDISADEKIVKLLEKSERRKEAVVVTDDRELRFLVRSLGAKVLSVEEFLLPLSSAGKKRKKETEPELSFTQKHAINAELRKLWLKE